MGTLVEKMLSDGTVETLHHNLPDGDALTLARNVIAGNETGSVRVRLTPFKWDDDNAEYVLDHDAAYELPRLVARDVAPDEVLAESPGAEKVGPSVDPPKPRRGRTNS